MLFAFAFIFLLVLIAVLGANIRPDKTKDANEMCLQAARKSPGFECYYIYLDQPPKKTSFFNRLFMGGDIPGINIIPAKEFWFKNDSLYYTNIENTNIVFSISLIEKKIKSIPYFKENNIVKKKFFLGSDKYGRDLLSRLMAGIFVSLSVGIIAVFISLLIGVSLGSAAGFFKSKTDTIISWIINVIWSIPTLLFVISVTLMLGKGFWQVFIAVGLTMWIEVARLVRGQVLSISSREYILAAQMAGIGNARIILRHILPNTIGPVVVLASANFANAILLEAGLSFLGLGAQPPTPSLGSIIKEHYGYITMNSAYLAIIPGILIMLMVLSFIIIGNTLRDYFDVKSDMNSV